MSSAREDNRPDDEWERDCLAWNLPRLRSQASERPDDTSAEEEQRVGEEDDAPAPAAA